MSDATVKLKLKPLMVPNFVGVEIAERTPLDGGLGSFSVPVRELDDDALEDLAYEFLVGFYNKAGKTCPFYRPARAA